MPSWSITSLVGATLALAAASALAQEATVTGVARPIDGDTFEIGAAMIRLHGIDAPETGQACARSDGTPWACDAAALDLLADLLGTHVVACDILETDHYGRLISVCRADGVEINAALVNSGLAWAFRTYSEDYVGLENAARAARVGVWRGGSDPEPPWAYRANRWERAVAASPDGCPIKGNISGGGRIYHTPWSPYYDRTSIDESRGERWFCDEAEAAEAGWRAPRPN